MGCMRILILGSVALPVPPKAQGGTERIAYLQAKGLAEKGHTVTLIGAVGSENNPLYHLVCIGKGDTVEGSQNADQIPGPVAVESSRKLRKESVYLAHVEKWLFDNGSAFDVMVNNMRAGESLFLSIACRLGIPLVNIMHLPIFQELADIFKEYDAPIITISDSQRKAFPDLRYVATVYNGIHVSEFPFSQIQGEYLLMMGTIAPHKNQKAGIEIAQKTGKKLIMAGKIGNQAYYDAEIAPQIDGVRVIHLGEIGFEEKTKLYKEAYALLFPVLWEEPFGLVMIEAMACGTPVVGYRRGAVPEVVRDGKTGFIVDTQDEMIQRVKDVPSIDRNYCRQLVSERFSNTGMVDAYEQALVSVVKK